MKKRILSLFLALVMLFSCMSLTLFAVDEATDLAEELEGESATTPTAGTVVSNTLKAHTAEMIEKLIPGYANGTSYYSFNSGTSEKAFTVGNVNAGGGLTFSNKAARFEVTEDGRFVYGAVTDADGFAALTGSAINDSYINVARHTDTGDAGKALSAYKNSISRGQNFTVQLDLEITDTFMKETAVTTAESGLPVMQIASYQHSSDSKNANVLKGIWVYYVKLSVTTDGRAYLAFNDNNAANNSDAKRFAENHYYIEPGKNYTISLHVDPQNVDSSAGIYGSYDVYINGELAFNDLGFLSNSQNNTLAKAEDVPYFSNSTTNTWTDSNYKTLKSGATAYFFTDKLTEEQLTKDTDNDGLLDILECISAYITFDTNGKATNAPTPEAIGTCKGAVDFCLGPVRLFQNLRNSADYSLVNPYTDDAYYFDNIMVYYGENYEGTLGGHDLVLGDHKHDFDENLTLVSYDCTICNGSKTVYETLDANSDRVCDICSGGIGYFGDYKKLTPTEIKNLVGNDFTSGGEFTKATDLNDYKWTYNIGGTNIAANAGSVAGDPDGRHTMFEQIVFVEENGNTYIKYQRPVTQYVTLENGKAINVDYGTEENGDYYYTGSLTGEYLQIDPHSTTIANVAADWNTLGGKPYVISVDYMFYGGYDLSLFELRSPTLLLKDTETTTKTSNISWYPVQIKKDGTVCYRNVDTNTWVTSGNKVPIGEWTTVSFYHTPATNSFDLYVDGLCVANGIKAVSDKNNIDYTGEEAWNNYDLVGNSAENYMLSMVRFTQMSTAVESDVMALDNIKIYYGEFLECDHKIEMTHSHDIANSKNTVTYTCTQCGKTESAVINMFSAADYRGSYLTTDEIKAYTQATGNILVKDADFTKNGAADWDGCSSSNATALEVVEIDGNHVLKYGSKDGEAPSGSSYTQASTPNVNSHANAVKNFAAYKGKSYTITLSLKLDEDFEGAYNASTGKYGANIANFFEVICYLAGTDGMTDADLKAMASSAQRKEFSPITLMANGDLAYKNYAGSFATGASTTSTKSTVVANLMDNAWHEITIHHTPANNTYALFFDGELVEKDITALSKANTDALTWSSSVFTNGGTVTDGVSNNIGYLDDAAIDPANGNKIFSVNGQTDFIPGIIRLAQYNPGPNNSMYIDNFKVYYTDEILECLHKDIDTEGICADCEKAVAPAHHCDICDGQAISESAAVVGRNAALGELIHMNAYLKLEKALAADENAKVVISAKDMTEEYLLSELATEENGTYKISLPLRSTYMTEEVTVEIVADGETSVAYTTTLTDYLTELAETSESEIEKALVKATLNYGAYAQLYFAEKNDDAALAKVLANAGLAEADKDVSAVTVADLADYKIAAKISGNIEITGATLVLTSSTIMKFYFKASENAKVTVNGRVQNPIADGEEYYVTINKTNPAQLGANNTIVITDGENTATVDVSILSAVEAVLTYGTLGESFENLAKAIYLYCEAAEKYTA